MFFCVILWLIVFPYFGHTQLIYFFISFCYYSLTLESELLSCTLSKNVMHSPKAGKYFIWLYIKKMVVVRYRGAYLGFIWNILQPLLYLLILGFVFATFNNAPLEDYVVYLFAGLIPWRFFEHSLISMTDSILLNSTFTKKIRMPSIYFPIIELGIAFVDFLSAFGVLLALLLLFKAKWHITMIIIPVSIALWVIISAGAGIILATLFVFFQDLKSLVQMGLMLLLFTSTIFFKAALFTHDPVKALFLKYDPVCYWVSLFQKPIYYGQWPGLMDWTVSLLSATILISFALILYNKTKHRFFYYM